MDFVIIFGFLAFCGVASSIAIATSRYTVDNFEEDEKMAICNKILSLDDVKKRYSHMKEEEILMKLERLKKNHHLRPIASRISNDINAINTKIEVMESFKPFIPNKHLVDCEAFELKKEKELILENCRNILSNISSVEKELRRITMKDLEIAQIDKLLEKNAECLNRANNIIENTAKGPIKKSNHFSEMEVKGLIRSLENKVVSQ